SDSDWPHAISHRRYLAGPSCVGSSCIEGGGMQPSSSVCKILLILFDTLHSVVGTIAIPYESLIYLPSDGPSGIADGFERCTCDASSTCIRRKSLRLGDCEHMTGELPLQYARRLPAPRYFYLTFVGASQFAKSVASLVARPSSQPDLEAIAMNTVP